MSTEVADQHVDLQVNGKPELVNIKDEQVDLKDIPISPNGDVEKPGSPETEGDHQPERIVTVLENKDHYNVKHPLQNTWSLWFTKPPTGKGDNWNELLKKIWTFDSVEEFWGTFNNVAPVSELALKSDYHLFKEDIRPEWEDIANKHGGKWSYQFKDKRSVPIDKLWRQVLLDAIGENLEEYGDDEVMGVVVNVRKAFYRIGLWTRTTGKPIPGRGDGDIAGGKGRSNEKGREVLLRIGRNFKKSLDLGDNDVIEFSSHTESSHAGSTRAKAKLTV